MLRRIVWTGVISFAVIVAVTSAVIWTGAYIPYVWEGAAVKDGMGYYPAPEHAETSATDKP